MSLLGRSDLRMSLLGRSDRRMPLLGQSDQDRTGMNSGDPGHRQVMSPLEVRYRAHCQRPVTPVDRPGIKSTTGEATLQDAHRW
jgi:hypothetical protein